MGKAGNPNWVKGESGNPAGKAIGTKDGATLIKLALEAVDKVGGVKYLVKQAKAHPVAFLAFIAKTMPRDTNVKLAGEITYDEALLRREARQKAAREAEAAKGGE